MKVFLRRTGAKAGAHMLKKRTVLKGNIAEYLVVGLIFLLLTIFYTDGVIFQGNNALFVSGPGDGTAGITWVSTFGDNKGLFPGRTDMVNYPVGADLSSPQQITALLLQLPISMLSHFMTVFMATNVMLLSALTGIGLLGYWLLKRLTGDMAIAFFAGFILAFMPYHIFKSVAHIANIFSWMFVATIAASVYLWRSPSWKSALLLGLSVAAGYYTDGYYILLSSVLVATLSIAGLIAHFIISKKKTALYIKYIFATVGITLVLAAPIIGVQLEAGKQVSSELSLARTDIKTEARYYSAWKLDFLTPPAQNPFFTNIPLYNQAQLKKSVRSNVAESALYVGYVVLLLAVIGIIYSLVIFLRLLRGHSLPTYISQSEWEILFLLSCYIFVAVPVILSFMGPLELNIGEHHIPTLSGILTDHSSLWRVLTRFILPLHALAAVYASYVLYIVTKPLKLIKRGRLAFMGIMLVLISMVAIEYATMVNRPPFSLDKMPRMYREVKNRTDIKVIAELPITDKPVEVNGYYATAQLIHGKKLINSQIIKYNDGEATALGDLNNPETVDYIRLRGADHVIVHAEMCRKYDWGTLESEEAVLPESYTLPVFSGKDYKKMCLYKINKQVVSDDSFVAVNLKDYMDASLQVQGTYETSVKNPTVELRVVDSADRTITSHSATKVSIDAKTTDGGTYRWTITQNSKVLGSGTVEGAGVSRIGSVIDPTKPFDLNFTPANGGSYGMGHMLLNNYESTLTVH